MSVRTRLYVRCTYGISETYTVLQSTPSIDDFTTTILGNSAENLNEIALTEEGWEALNKRWVYFFFGLALLNEIVWRTQSEEFWVNFKVWGLLPITFIFTAFQIGLINKYKINE